MFSGIVEEVGKILNVTERAGTRRLSIQTSLEAKRGDSISVNGVCLTVSGTGAGSLEVDASKETLSRTNLRFLRRESSVNLERALRLGSRIGGHFVSGHVDTITRVVSVMRTGDTMKLRIRLPKVIEPFVVPKGSLAVDGMSVTVAELFDSIAGFVLIPETLKRTISSSYVRGSLVNVEADMLVKAARKVDSEILSKEYLALQGY